MCTCTVSLEKIKVTTKWKEKSHIEKNGKSVRFKYSNYTIINVWSSLGLIGIFFCQSKDMVSSRSRVRSTKNYELYDFE